MPRAPAGLAEFRSGFAGQTFGDAGAAAVVEAVERGGILAVDTATHSEHWEVGGIPDGGPRHPRGDAYPYVQGDGHELRGAFEEVGTAVLDRTLHRTGFAEALVVLDVRRARSRGWNPGRALEDCLSSPRG